MSVPLALDNDNTPSFISELLYRLKVRDVMTSKLICAKPRDSLRYVQKLMKDNTITGVPIHENKRMLGIISVDDILRALDEGYIEESVEHHMTRNVISLEDDMPLAFALSFMDKHHFGRFPVLDRTGILVGIITSRDIIMHLLLAMNQEMSLMEEKLKPLSPRIPNPDTQEQILEFTTRRFDFENAGKASSEIKKVCTQAQIPSKIIRRIAVASYELEMNQVIHSQGGIIRFTLDAQKAQVFVQDQGPGIEDLEKALQEGFSTATEWVRSLGFGAGMGLPNTKRVSDDFSIESSAASGTKVLCTFDISKEN